MNNFFTKLNELKQILKFKKRILKDFLNNLKIN